MYRQVESECRGVGVSKLELIAALCDAGGVPRMQAVGMADDLLKGAELLEDPGIDGGREEGLREEEWMAFWDGMKQLSPTQQHEIKMLSDLRWTLGMPPLGA